MEIMTPRKFEEVIEDIVWELDVSHFDAVLIYCERNSLDIEDVSKLFNKTLKEKLQFDAVKEGYKVITVQLPL